MKNILFCLLQNPDDTQWIINSPFYDLQVLAKNSSKKKQIKKAIVYGKKLIHTKGFETTKIDDIYYAKDDEIEEKNGQINVYGSHLIVMSDLLLEESINKNPNQEHFLVILRENQMRMEDAYRIVSYYNNKRPQYSIILVESKICKDDFRDYIIENNHIICTFDDLTPAYDKLNI